MAVKTKKKKKRVARKVMAPKMDTTVPIDVIGSKDDPCFGKSNDPRHPTCMRCGDIEICAIAMGQGNHIKRLIEEKSKSFKDIEETKITHPDKAQQKRDILARMKEMIKDGLYEEEEIVQDIYGKYMTNGWKQVRIRKLMRFLKSKYPITTRKNKLTWKKQ